MTAIRRALKVRLYPDKNQEITLRQNIGCCRAIYNMMLYDRKIQYDEFLEKKKLNPNLVFSPNYKTQKQLRDKNLWLKEASSGALCQVIRHLDKSFSNFFKGLNGKRQDKPGFPRFKRKRSGGSFTLYVDTKPKFKGDNTGTIKLPKIKQPVKFKDPRIIGDSDRIRSVTVSMSATGKFFASIMYERDITIPSPITQDPKTKGLDMSLGKFIVDDTGWSPVEFQRFYRLNEDKLKFLQRIVLRRKKGSENQKKAQHRVNILHERISNKRNDFIHKLSTMLSNKNDIIVVETLDLKRMSQDHHGKSVYDLGFSEFVRQLEYKLAERGKKLIKAPKFFLSSKTCSNCGLINKELKLSDRTWTCEKCGIEHDRDHNAAKNLNKLSQIAAKCVIDALIEYSNTMEKEKLGPEGSESTSGEMGSLDPVREPENPDREVGRCQFAESSAGW